MAPIHGVIEAFAHFSDSLAAAAAHCEHQAQEYKCEKEQVEDGHGAHIDEEVLRLEANGLEIGIDGLRWRDAKVLVDDVREVIEVKRCNAHHVGEEDSSVGRHRYFEEWHHHDELLRVDHRPELLQAGRDQYVYYYVGGECELGGSLDTADDLLHLRLGAV